MAYLTQYSNSVPVIKHLIEQTHMSIGQNINMDICIPEDSIAENHATLESIKSDQSYRFMIKSTENESLVELNGKAIISAELQDGDWLIIGGVEFQFTDDSVNLIIEKSVAIMSTVYDKPKLVVKPSLKSVDSESDALKLIRELKQDLQSEDKLLTTKEFIANSRQSRRRLAF